MSYNCESFMHEADSKALAALKSIPGFTPLLKAFMAGWSEKQFLLMNMGSNLRLGPEQMPEYYNMLLPICEKLGIEVPELYLEMNVVPNAYTTGDSKPIIVMTTGLLDTMPKELIPTVLAHECGHIACHHVLYHTMGKLILSGSASLMGLGGLISLPLQLAFFYWMRCSEYSADRAAVLCDGSSDKVVEMCMRFAGYGNRQINETSVEQFLKQAIDYRDLVDESNLNKTVEFLLTSGNTHPLNAIRASEAKNWCTSEQFNNVLNPESFYFAVEETKQEVKDIVMPYSNWRYVNRNVEEVTNIFKQLGFFNIKEERVLERPLLSIAKENDVVAFSINGVNEFEKDAVFKSDAEIILQVYRPLSLKEAEAAHPGMIYIKDNYRRYYGRNYLEVANELVELGFKNIRTYSQPDLKNTWLIKENSLCDIVIDGCDNFEKGSWFSADSDVILRYHSLIEQ